MARNKYFAYIEKEKEADSTTQGGSTRKGESSQSHDRMPSESKPPPNPQDKTPRKSEQAEPSQPHNMTPGKSEPPQPQRKASGCQSEPPQSDVAEHAKLDRILMS